MTSAQPFSGSRVNLARIYEKNLARLETLEKKLETTTEQDVGYAWIEFLGLIADCMHIMKQFQALVVDVVFLFVQRFYSWSISGPVSQTATNATAYWRVSVYTVQGYLHFAYSH